MIGRLSLLSVLPCVLLSAAPVAADEGLATFSGFANEALARLGVTQAEAWKQHLLLSSAEFDSCSAFVVSKRGLVVTDAACASRCLRAAQLAEVETAMFSGACKSAALRQAIPLFDLLYCAPIEARAFGNRFTRGFVAKRESEEIACGPQLLRLVRRAEKKTASSLPCLAADGCDEVPLGSSVELVAYDMIKDARLVFAPERDVTTFGGVGGRFAAPYTQFSVAFVRAYKDGAPLDTPAYLQLSDARVSEGEQVFLTGSPSSTTRHMPRALVEDLRRLYETILRVAIEGRGLSGGITALAPNERNKRGLQGVENFAAELRASLEGHDEALARASAARDAALRSHFEKDQRALVRLDEIAAALSESAKRNSSEMVTSILEYSSEHLIGSAVRLVIAAQELALPPEQRLSSHRQIDAQGLSRDFQARSPERNEEVAGLALMLRVFQDGLPKDSLLLRKLLANKDPLSRAQELIGGSELHKPRVMRDLWRGGLPAIEASDDPLIVLARELSPWLKKHMRERERINTRDTALLQEYLALCSAAGLLAYPESVGTPRLRSGRVLGVREGTTQAALSPLGVMFGFDGQNGRVLPERWRARKAALDLSMPVSALADTDAVISINGHQSDAGAAVVSVTGEAVGVAFGGTPAAQHAALRFAPATSRTAFVTSEALLHLLAQVYDAGALVHELNGAGETARR